MDSKIVKLSPDVALIFVFFFLNVVYLESSRIGKP